MRIVSLLPSATEITFALGLGEEIVGVTHECDYPPEAASKPRVTMTTLDRSMSSADLDAATAGHLDAGTTSYRLDLELLRDLAPDLILTQTLCEVCAVPHSLVSGALPRLPSRPRVLSLAPKRFGDLFSTIKTVGDHTGRSAAARALVDQLKCRVDAVALGAARAKLRRVVCLEWIDPLWSAGHWVPDMVGLAGGIELLGGSGEPSRRTSWPSLSRAAPDVLVIAACGFDLPRTLEEVDRTSFPQEWWELPAVRAGNAFAVDGSAYFTRPGPRLVDGIELLAELFTLPSEVANDRWVRVRRDP